jgi:hypothetical protein
VQTGYVVLQVVQAVNIETPQLVAANHVQADRHVECGLAIFLSGDGDFTEGYGRLIVPGVSKG